jgi:hypothetical protein
VLSVAGAAWAPSRVGWVVSWSIVSASAQMMART